MAKIFKALKNKSINLFDDQFAVHTELIQIATNE